MDKNDYQEEDECLGMMFEEEDDKEKKFKGILGFCKKKRDKEGIIYPLFTQPNIMEDEENDSDEGKDIVDEKDDDDDVIENLNIVKIKGNVDYMATFHQRNLINLNRPLPSISRPEKNQQQHQQQQQQLQSQLQPPSYSYNVNVPYRTATTATKRKTYSPNIQKLLRRGI